MVIAFRFFLFDMRAKCTPAIEHPHHCLIQNMFRRMHPRIILFSIWNNLIHLFESMSWAITLYYTCLNIRYSLDFIYEQIVPAFFHCSSCNYPNYFRLYNRVLIDILSSKRNHHICLDPFASLVGPLLLFSVIIILLEISNLLTNPMEQFNMVFQMFPQAKSGMDAMTGYVPIQPHLVGLYDSVFLVRVCWINTIFPFPSNRQNDS